MSRLHFSGLFLAVSLALAGCGGGGSGGNNGGPSTKTPTYTGSTAPAVATEENASDLATASIEGVKAAVRDDALELFLALQQAPQQEPAEWLASHSIDLLKNWPATSSPTLRAATELLTGTCGGNVTMEQGAETATSSTIYLRYNNYCMEGDGPNDRIIIDGRMRITTSETATHEIITMAFENLRITDGGETYYINTSMTVTCSLQDEDDCTFEHTSIFVGEDGRTYQLANVELDGDNASGFDIDARIYHSSHGYVDFTARGITICDNGNIGTGSIKISDSSGEVMELTFSSCDQYTLTYNGVATIHPQ